MGVSLSAGTLYAVISRLEAQGLIEGLDAVDRRRPYRLTAAGGEALARQTSRMGTVAALAQTRLSAQPRMAQPWRLSLDGSSLDGGGVTAMTNPPSRRRGATALARAALRLYPSAWRARYGDEVIALIEDTGACLAAAVSLAWRSLPAWIWPPRQLHDRESRMRASLGTVLVAGALLGGVGLVFAQLTQLQGLRAQGSPVVLGSYAIFDVAMAVAGLTAVAGGFPLWLRCCAVPAGSTAAARPRTCCSRSRHRPRSSPYCPRWSGLRRSCRRQPVDLPCRRAARLRAAVTACAGPVLAMRAPAAPRPRGTARGPGSRRRDRRHRAGRVLQRRRAGLPACGRATSPATTRIVLGGYLAVVAAWRRSRVSVPGAPSGSGNPACPRPARDLACRVAC